MIPALICVGSAAAFLQFFVSYCRSILAASGKIELSLRVREVTGVTGRSFTAEDFHRLLQFIHLCPEGGSDNGEIRAVGAYFQFLSALRHLCSIVVPKVAAWAEGERRNCSYFAAVALDRRISHSRDLFNQQAAGSI